jgi:hypothetical protein
MRDHTIYYAGTARQRTAVAMRRNAEPDRRADVERVGRELARLRDGR